MRSRYPGPLGRLGAWLVTGPLGRGLAFAIDFAAALRRLISDR
jgi:transketolase